MRVPTLYQFFRHQLQRGFHAHGFREPATVDYVSDILTRFAQTRALYALRNAEGRPLEHIVDMLAEHNEAQCVRRGHGGRARERRAIRHIGEYTLFMSGLFRERIRARGQLGYYLAHGRTAFWRCADYELNPKQQHLYRRLYYDFGPISDVLDHIRQTQFPLGDTASGNPLAAFWRA